MGFETLREIAEENRRLAEDAATRPPTTCPIDGATLEIRAGVRNCPMGNYRWDGEGHELSGPGVWSDELAVR